MKKGLALCVAFLVCVFGMCVAFWAIPDGTFSDMENRTLSQMPRFSFSSLADGSFTTKFETYLNDQFPFRTWFVRVNAEMNVFSGRQDVNGVYLADGGALIPAFDAGETVALQNARRVSEFARACGVPVTLALVPGSAAIWQDRLPQNAPNPDQKARIERVCEAAGVPAADLYGALLSHADEPVYYRTDHHWTSLGAYYGYEALADALGYTPVPLGEATVLSDRFFGTLYAKAPLWQIRADSIEAYVEDRGISVEADTGGGIRKGTLYWPDKLKTRDQYNVFLGDNAPRIVVTTPHQDAPKLLILRDSYCDALAPFLTAHYSEIHLLDPRYWRLSVSEYMAEKGIDQLLICYSLANFSTDAYLQLVLK